MFAMKRGKLSAFNELQLEQGQFIGRVVQTLGNNLYQVETREPENKNEKYLLPKRLRLLSCISVALFVIYFI